jgi:hypothetical protein
LRQEMVFGALVDCHGAVFVPSRISASVRRWRDRRPLAPMRKAVRRQSEAVSPHRDDRHTLADLGQTHLVAGAQSRYCAPENPWLVDPAEFSPALRVTCQRFAEAQEDGIISARGFPR